MSAHLTGDDFKSLSEITAAGGTAVNLLNDSKIYVTANNLNETLNTAIANGDLGGQGGINYVTNYKALNTTGWTTFNEAVPVTISIASPAVFTTSSPHNFQVGQGLTFSTTGSLPTGLTSNTTYYVVAVPTSTTYQVSATLGGSALATSGTQSGTHTSYPNTPVNLTSSSLSGLSFTTSSTNPLRYSNQFVLTQSNSSKVQGQGVYYSITNLSNADKAKVLQISFDYNASSTFQASSGNVQVSPYESDVEIFIKDVTNNVLIPVNPKTITSNGANNFTYKGYFQTSSNSNSYLLIVYCATANASATGWTFAFDNVSVSPIQTQAYPILSDWSKNLTFSPSASLGVGTGNYTASLQYQRNGDMCRVRGFIVTGTTTSSIAYIQLPFSIDYSKIPYSSTGSYVPHYPVGTFTFPYSTTSNTYNPVTAGFYDPMFVDGTTPNQVFFGYQTTNQQYVKALGTSVGYNNNPLYVDFEVPVLGWSSGTAQIGLDTDSRVCIASYYASSSQSVSPTQPANFDSKITDTHGSVQIGSAWKFVSPTSGFYQLSGFVASTSTSGAGWMLYKNGVSYKTLSDPANASYGSAFSSVIFLQAGDYIDFRKVNTGTISGGSLGAVDTSYIDIVKIQGPNTVLPSETVNASYGLVADLSIPSNGTVTPVWNSKIVDSHNGMNLTTGSYTVITPGVYSIQIQSYIAPGTASSGWVATQIIKNGTGISTNATNTGATTSPTSNTVFYTGRFGAGDIISSIVGINSIGASTLKAAPAGLFNNQGIASQISIVRVGN